MPWFDGKVYDQSIVPFDLADRGLLLGDGVFDTSLVLGGKMVWRDAHVARLAAACRTLGFKIDPARIDAAIDGVLTGAGQGSLRVTVTRGTAPRGLAPPQDPKPTVFATLSPLRAAALFAAVKLAVTPIRRNDTSPFSRVKTIGYLDAIHATTAALASGCDDALFLNTRDKVACTTIANVFAIFGDQLVTPPLGDGAIAGTARKLILATCDEEGLEAVERSMPLAELMEADAVVVTSSLRLVAPVTRLDRKHLGSSGAMRAQGLIAHVARLVRGETGVDPRKLDA